MDAAQDEFRIPQDEESHRERDYGVHPDRFEDVRTLLSWSAPGRPFRQKGRQFYLTITLLVFLIQIILFLFAEYQLMAVVLALAFLAVALAYNPPKDFHYKITTEGIKVEDHFYLWKELYDFYFKHVDGMDVLIVRTEAFLPGELRISLGNITQEHVRKILVNFIPFRDYVRPTFMEKAGDWLARNFPLDNA
jgi:hypothetical protein